MHSCIRLVRVWQVHGLLAAAQYSGGQVTKQWDGLLSPSCCILHIEHLKLFEGSTGIR